MGYKPAIVHLSTRSVTGSAQPITGDSWHACVSLLAPQIDRSLFGARPTGSVRSNGGGVHRHCTKLMQIVLFRQTLHLLGSWPV